MQNYLLLENIEKKKKKKNLIKYNIIIKKNKKIFLT